MTEPKKTIQEMFLEYDVANPHVYEGLKRLAFQAYHAGRARTSVKMFVDVLRWEHYMTTEDPYSDYKINDKYTSRYVRKLIAEYPQLTDLFETRVLRSA